MSPATIDEPATSNSHGTRSTEPEGFDREGGGAADAGAADNGEAHAGERAADQVGAALHGMRSEFVQGIGALKRAFYIERQALGLALFDSAFHAVAVAASAIVCTVLAIAASILMVLGVRRGLEQWSGGAWWGDVLLSSVILVILVGGAYAYRRWMHRSTLTKVRRELAERTHAGTDGKDAS